MASSKARSGGVGLGGRSCHHDKYEMGDGEVSFSKGILMSSVSGIIRTKRTHSCLVHRKMTLSWRVCIALFVLWALICARTCSAQQDLLYYSVKENQPVGTFVGSLQDDTSFGSPFTTLNPSAEFMIESDTGIITTGAVLDRETAPDQEFVIIVFAGEMFTALVVTIRLNDTNDNNPIFSQDNRTFEVTEAVQPYMTKINGVTATDADEGINGIQGYRIVGGNIDNTFDLDVRVRETGVYMDIVVNKTLDRETISMYTLIIEAYDGGDPRLTANTTVNIKVTDVNDNSPVFTLTSFTATINESAPVNTTVLQVTASDEDEGLNGEVVFNLQRDDGFFRIDPASGIVYLNKVLNYEDAQAHDFLVIAQDKAEPPMSSQPAYVSIMVININEKPPSLEVLFLPDGGASQVSEAAVADTTLARISVTDPDDGVLTNVSMTITGGAGQFDLQKNSNQVYFLIVATTASSFDREEVASYDISIRATDHGSPPQHAEENLTIAVTDVNDNPPIFDLPLYHATIIEASEPGTPVKQVHATDADEGVNAQIIYRISPEGTDFSDWFEINPMSGLVTTLQKVDREETGSVFLTVIASDEGEISLSSSVIINITITDVNDNQPVFFPGSYNASILEEQEIPYCFLQVVKLWDFETGHLVFEFSQAHNNNAVTAMSFDNTGRRLITGGRDGRLKIWNYNNGHCLKVLEKAEGNDEVTDVVYIEMNKNRYVISVGWDRSINVYTDSSEDFRHVQRPMPRWTDDEKNGHQEDILSVSACPPSLLATSSYDGEIIVWNLVSGYAYSHIQSTKYFDDADEKYKGDGDESISKVLFIPSRRTNKESAQLVASGPRGCIHFWNVYNNGQLFGRFNCVKKKGISVNCMLLSNDDLTLFTGDALGFVSVWDIDHYCLDRPDNIEEAPELMGSWRGHIQSITSMSLVEEHSILITSSLDCTVRLWTTEGHYVGTFGQDEPWDVFNPNTFKHPMVPYDVLVDPQSMPNHPIFDQKSSSSMSEYICDESLDDGQTGGETDMLDDGSGSSHGDEIEEKEEVEEREDDKKSESTSYISTREKFVYDDDMIAAELKKKPFNRGSGKRLRHEKLRSMPKERAVTSAYQTLKCFDLEDTPPLPPPSRSKDKTSDPFTFS